MTFLFWGVRTIFLGFIGHLMRLSSNEGELDNSIQEVHVHGGRFFVKVAKCYKLEFVLPLEIWLLNVY